MSESTDRLTGAVTYITNTPVVGRNLAAAAPADGYGRAGTVIIMGIKRAGVWEMWRQLQTDGPLEAARIDL